jgi:competence protein ComEC
MTAGVLAFVAGVLLLQAQGALPPVAWLWGLPACLALGAWRPGLRLAAAFAVGFLWAAGWAQLRIADRLAPGLEGRELQVVGVVSGLPAAGERGLRFDFEPESAPEGVRLPRKSRLAWYALPPPAPAPEVRPGERWRFAVRLRRPHGQVNPHGFDYEAWLLERGVGATGYVRAFPPPERLGARDGALDRIEQAREAVRERFLGVLGATPAAGILAALAIGDQRAISGEEWRLFRRTGVTHLMSISGLHVTLVSGLIAWLVAFGWRRLPWLCLLLPARKAAAAAAVAAALGYTLLAGFGVPAQRTLLMVCAVALALWSGRLVSPARTLALALGAVVLADPWAPLAPGFWLSFGAVALIFYVAAGWTGAESKVLQWGRVQWAVTLGLAPAALLLFGQVSLVGPLANAVAIPLVSVVVTPLALLGAVLPLDAILQFAAWLAERLLEILEACASLPLAVWHARVPPAWSVPLALAGVAWLLAPRGLPWRASGLALMLPAFALPAPAPAPGEAWVTTLDVGQGRSVLVRTAQHALLFDAGPAFAGEGDAGERTVVPLLRASGVARLDAMVLSRDDADHVGGASSVMESVPTGALLNSLPARHPALALAASPRRCAHGDAWEWDGVNFEVLGAGCALRVSSGGHAVLLPGAGARAPAAAQAPGWVVFSVGYRNRFRQPSKAVLARTLAAGARTLRTDRDGAVSLRLGAAGVTVEVERLRRARYWRGI